MEEFLREHGFAPADNDPTILEASFTEEESTYLADGLGITDEYDLLIVQYDTVNDTVTICIDGAIDTVEPEELREALGDD